MMSSLVTSVAALTQDFSHVHIVALSNLYGQAPLFLPKLDMMSCKSLKKLPFSNTTTPTTALPQSLQGKLNSERISAVNRAFLEKNLNSLIFPESLLRSIVFL